MSTPPRDIVFISKATPGDDNFALWLAPKLEAAGYRVFADVISLRAGDSWRQRLTETLRDQAVKMLLCCKDSTLQKTGVQEEIGIASHVMGVTGDKQFIIPLRLEAFAPTFGLANTQFVDFKTNWAQGLDRLLDEMRKAHVQAANVDHDINPAWEVMRRHLISAYLVAIIGGVVIGIALSYPAYRLAYRSKAEEIRCKSCGAEFALREVISFDSARDTNTVWENSDLKRFKCRACDAEHIGRSSLSINADHRAFKH